MDGLEAQKMPYIEAVNDAHKKLQAAKDQLKHIRAVCKRAKVDLKTKTNSIEAYVSYSSSD